MATLTRITLSQMYTACIHVYKQSLLLSLHSVYHTGKCLKCGHTYHNNIVTDVHSMHTCIQHNHHRHGLNMSTHNIRVPRDQIHMDPQTIMSPRLSGKKHMITAPLTDKMDRPSKKAKNEQIVLENSAKITRERLAAQHRTEKN